VGGDTGTLGFSVPFCALVRRGYKSIAFLLRGINGKVDRKDV